MIDQILKLALSKVDPKTATEAVQHFNKAMETQERMAKAQEEIAARLGDITELLKKRGAK
ncbi:MAG: hypothetical protein PHP10_03670 [Candidatus Omnitrophica bacterium]|nr:hypothetical protein [Candidatus Omnitrophota bacterium]